jgi:hypothetical protein
MRVCRASTGGRSGGQGPTRASKSCVIPEGTYPNRRNGPDTSTCPERARELAWIPFRY